MKLVDSFIKEMVKSGIAKEDIQVIETGEDKSVALSFFLQSDNDMLLQIGLYIMDDGKEVDVSVRQHIEDFDMNNKLKLLDKMNELNMSYRKVVFYYSEDSGEIMTVAKISDTIDNDLDKLLVITMSCVQVADEEFPTLI